MKNSSHCGGAQLGSGFGVSNGVVATETADSLGVAVVSGIDGLNNVAVASAAGVFGYMSAGIADLNIVGEISGSEVKRMKESVAGFYGVFAREVVGSVTIVAGCGMFVATLDPAVVLRIHDMAIRAGLWIIGEIGIP